MMKKHATSGGLRVGRRQEGRDTWKKPTRIALYALLFVAFLELSSAFLLDKAVSPSRMKRFDDLFFVEPLERDVLPHPYLGWVDQRYLREQERYLNRLGKDRNETVYIVAMGGSTTADGWPQYTETYLNGRLQEMDAPLRVEVFNFGGGGWTTIDSIQNYVLITRFLHPDIVIFHHNINDWGIYESSFEWFRCQQETLQYPQIGRWERALLRGSRFYKLLRFAYLLSYNPARYGKGVVKETDVDLPMQSHISSYLNSLDPWADARVYFTASSLRLGILPEASRGFVLNESYEWLIKATRSDNTALVMTTMYLNYSKQADTWDAPSKEWAQDRDAINELIRQASRQHNVGLVDLAEEMEPYDSLLTDDGVHWEEEGVRLKGELVGEAVFDIVDERYNLSG